MLRFLKISVYRRLRQAGLILLTALCLLLSTPAIAEEENLPPAWQVVGIAGREPTVQAEAAALIDAHSGRVLWQRNGYQPAPPASTTKILTALLALDMAPTDTLCEVSARAAAVGESTIYLRPGERLSLADLLRGTLIRSGNDAAYAVGESVAGSEPLFVAWMNMKAAALGAFSTDFQNTNGLPAVRHQISAADLAQLTRQALNDDFFAATVAQKNVNIGSGSSARHLQNTNKLLWHDEHITGVKTGTTNAAGPCLVASMESGDTRLISVVFNSPDRYGDCLRLLRYGEAEFTALPLLKAGQAVAYMPVQRGRQAGVLLITEGETWCAFSREEAAGLSLRWCLPARINAPVAAGQHVGSLRVYNQTGEELAFISLAAAETVDAAPQPWWRRILTSGH